jgi:hypothetical protein
MRCKDKICTARINYCIADRKADDASFTKPVKFTKVNWEHSCALTKSRERGHPASVVEVIANEKVPFKPRTDRGDAKQFLMTLKDQGISPPSL